jgi:hypothetical protein
LNAGLIERNEIDAYSYVHTQPVYKMKKWTRINVIEKENRVDFYENYSPGCSGHDRLIRNQLSIQLNKWNKLYIKKEPIDISWTHFPWTIYAIELK